MDPVLSPESEYSEDRFSNSLLQYEYGPPGSSPFRPVNISQVDSKSNSISSLSNPNNFDVTAIDIPSWKLRKDEDKTVFVVYLVHVTVKSGLKWVVEKRYQQFRELRHEIIKSCPEFSVVHFPSKHWFFNLSEALIKRRQKTLASYLNAILFLDPRPPQLANFLQVTLNVTSILDSSITDIRRSSSLGSINASLSIHDFKLVKVLGKGSFGKVFLVRPLSSSTKEVYAMKVLKKSEVVKRHQVDHTKAERWILEKVKHPFVLSLKYAFQTSHKLYMIFEYCAGGELFFHLKRMRRFTEPMMKFYCAQLSSALNHLHINNVIYRDLKPENILLDRNGNCVITDFGLSKIITPDVNPIHNTFCGTPEYLSPEMLLHRQRGIGYGKEIDWWALGVVCFELLTGWPPFYDRDFTHMCEKILTRPVKFPSKYHISGDAQALIKSLLTRDPAKRLCCGRYADSPNRGLESMKKHVFFMGFHWDAMERKEMKPPFLPVIGHSAEDTQNFDKEFTKMALKESPVDHRIVTEDLFDGFSFSEEFSHMTPEKLARHEIPDHILHLENNNDVPYDPSLESFIRHSEYLPGYSIGPSLMSSNSYSQGSELPHSNSISTVDHDDSSLDHSVGTKKKSSSSNSRNLVTPPARNNNSLNVHESSEGISRANLKGSSIGSRSQQEDTSDSGSGSNSNSNSNSNSKKSNLGSSTSTNDRVVEVSAEDGSRSNPIIENNSVFSPNRNVADRNSY